MAVSVIRAPHEILLGAGHRHERREGCARRREGCGQRIGDRVTSDPDAAPRLGRAKARDVVEVGDHRDQAGHEGHQGQAEPGGLDRARRTDALFGVSRSRQRGHPSCVALVRRSHHARVPRDHRARRRASAARMGEQPCARRFHVAESAVAQEERARGIRAPGQSGASQGLHPLSADRQAGHRALRRVGHADVRHRASALEPADHGGLGARHGLASRRGRQRRGARTSERQGSQSDRPRGRNSGGRRRRRQRVRRGGSRARFSWRSSGELGHVGNGAHPDRDAAGRSRNARAHVLPRGSQHLVLDGRDVDRGRRVRLAQARARARACAARRTSTSFSIAKRRRSHRAPRVSLSFPICRAKERRTATPPREAHSSGCRWLTRERTCRAR